MAKQSRAQRLAAALEEISNATNVIEELKDELDEWRNNLPENLEDSATAQKLDEAMDALETLKDEIDGACYAADDIEWPLGFGRD